MAGSGRRMPQLGAGRKPAGLALLGWLDDPRAPRLCRVAGPPGSGKSHLLAWLVRGCTTEDTPGGRRIHAVLPAAGATVRTAVWSLGQQLDLVAHDPGPLVAAIAADGRPTVVCVPELDLAEDPAALVTGLLDPLLRLPGVRLVIETATDGPAARAFTGVPAAVLDLGEPQWTDAARFAAWAVEQGGDPARYPLPGPVLGERAAAPAPVPPVFAPGTELRSVGEEPLTALWTAAVAAGEPGPLAADPLLYALARPVPVTAAVERRDDALARAWRAAGPAVIEEPDPAVRAAVLRLRLLGGDTVAAAAATVLAQLPAPWAGRWARWERVDRDWPGPAVALTAGAGPYLSQVLVADPTGSVRTFDAATGRRLGAVVVPAPRPLRGLAVTAGGSTVLLDAWGRPELVVPAEPRPGLEPYGLMAALDAMAAAAGDLSAVAAIGGLADSAPALGDANGAVHWFEDGKVVSERLHHGPVTALAGTALGGGPLSDPEVPLLVSGGFDGAVRLWGPRSAPMPEPSDRRGCPVTAVAAGATAAGPVVAAAWSDGLVRVRDLGTGGVLDVRTGSEVWSLALAGTLLVLGMPDGLAAVDTRR